MNAFGKTTPAGIHWPTTVPMVLCMCHVMAGEGVKGVDYSLMCAVFAVSVECCARINSVLSWVAVTPAVLFAVVGFIGEACFNHLYHRQFMPKGARS